MSSTQVIKDTVIQPWPVAKFFLYFYAADDTLKGTRRDDLFNYVNSTLIYNAFGYHLPKPEWLFAYCDDECAVLKVLSKDPVETDSAKCELWVSMKIGEKPYIHKWNEDHPCVRYFSTACYTQYPTEVYDPVLCGE
ncbi:hypothetical protein MRX96_047826 [Rhipicephalus microplus]